MDHPPTSNSTAEYRQTRMAFFGTRLLNMPFWAIFNMLQVILYKDLHASPLQITALVALRPIASLFSPYWSVLIHERQDRLVPNLLWANIIKCLPFLCIPFLNNIWLIILSCALCMVFARAVIPAWMEIIKVNIKGTARERLLATGSLIEYLGSAIIPISFGWLLDAYPHSWSWLLSITALIGISSTYLLMRIPIESKPIAANPSIQSFWEQISNPWKRSWELMKQRPDFRDFQIAFALEGAGLMMILTILPMFFVDTLQLSYTEILFALTICKAIGFSLSTPLWVKHFSRTNIFAFCSGVTLLAAFFPLLLICAAYHVVWVYIAYIIYGVMQAGSELGWHMSGPQFAKEHDSSLYSGTNILSVGIRGCVSPLLGMLIYSLSNSTFVLITGLLFCLLSTERMTVFSKRYHGLPNAKTVET